jgi:diguanylate cyclase (GGDEF)-like protein
MTSPGGNSDRNRELIASSAALLSADYPLDVLIERLCNAIAVAMDAVVYVALPKESGAVAISYVSQRGQRFDRKAQLVPERSWVARAFHSGRPVLLRSYDDWNGDVDEVLAGANESGVSQSAVYVPVKYGDDVLGVVAVGHDGAEQFDRDDVRLLEAVGRYLAMAVRNQRALRISAARSSFPWPWVIALVIAAVIATGIVGVRARQTGEAIDADARAEQYVRLSNLENVLSGFLAEDSRFARIAAAVLGPARSDPVTMQTLMTRLVRARESESVYGVGIFYVPLRGESAAPHQWPYAAIYNGRTGVVVKMGQKTANPAVVSWYRASATAHGDVIFTNPYRQNGVTFISAVKAFPAGSGLTGVVTVDTLVSALEELIAGQIASGERAYVTNGNDETIFASSQTGELEAPHAAAMSIVGTTWTLHLVSSFDDVEREQQQTFVGALAVGATIWIVAAGLFFFILVAHRTRRYAAGLKVQRAELQSEIATRIEAEEKLRVAAYHDALTGLPNRMFLIDQLRDVLNQRRHGVGSEYAVLFIDLDRFYVVNDSFGHAAGDLLLTAIAERLDSVIPPHALLARLGGDEFVLLLAGASPVLKEAKDTAEAILDALRAPFFLGDRELYTGASIGVMVVDESYMDADAILRDADLSMYRAKGAGRGRYAIFDRSMRDQAAHQLSLEGDLRGAVERGEIEPYYQPIVRLSDRALVGFEALVRWNRSGHGMLTAGDFVPLAEQSGLLRAIDVAMFEQVCQDAVVLTAGSPGVKISVNLSASDLTRAPVLPDIESALERFGVDPKMFTLEITETAVMEDADRALSVLHALRARGFDIVVDDFGVGYSSLSYLQRLPVRGVKIDRSFIVSLPADTQALEIVRGIVALAKTLGLYVTAEGAETEDQVTLLTSLGVDYGQGFWFSHPLDLASARMLLAVRS